MSAAPKHSHLGASSRHRWANCSGSNQLIESLGPLPAVSRPSADRGTMLHEFAAGALRAYFEGRADAPMPVDDRADAPMPVDDEDRESVRFYVDAVAKLMQSCRLLHEPCEPIIYIEERFALPAAVHPGMFGTVDFAAWCPVCCALIVADYKTGFHEVSPVENKQLLFYAAAVMVRANNAPRVARLAIIQPQAYGPPKPWVIPGERLEMELDTLRRETLATLVPGAPRVAGDWCRYCPAAAVCPERQAEANALAAQEFSAVIPAAPNYDPAELARYFAMIPRLKAWIEQVSSFAHAEAQHGRVIPGYKLVAKREGPRKWRDETKARVALLQLGLLVTQIEEPASLRSPAQIEKRVPGKNEKERAAKIADLTVRESSGHTLVAVNDDRAAIPTKPEEEFASRSTSTLLPEV